MRFTIDTDAIRSAMKTISSLGKSKESSYTVSALNGSVVLIPEEGSLHLHTATGTVSSEIVLYSDETNLVVEDGGMIGIQIDNLVAALDVQRSSRVQFTYDHKTKYMTVEGAGGEDGSPQKVTIKTDSAEAVSENDLKKPEFNRDEVVIEADSDIITSDLLEFTPTSNQDALFGDAIMIAHVDGKVNLIIREAQEGMFLGYKMIPCDVINEFDDIPVPTSYTRVVCNAIRSASDSDARVCINHRLGTHERRIRFTVVKDDKVYLDVIVPQSDAYINSEISSKDLISRINSLVTGNIVTEVVANQANLSRELDAATKVGALSDSLLPGDSSPLKNVLFQVGDQEVTVASSQQDSRYTGSVVTENDPGNDGAIPMLMSMSKVGKFLQGHPFGHQENINMYVYDTLLDKGVYVVALTPEGEEPSKDPSGTVMFVAQEN